MGIVELELTDWKVALKEDILNGGLKRVGAISTFLKEFVAKYPGLQWRTAQKEYYDIQRELKTFDDDQQSAPEVEPASAALAAKPVVQRKEPKDQVIAAYPAQTSIKVRVTDVKPYAAFVKTMDDHEISGIIHKSQVVDSFVSDCNKYFKFADELYVQVLKYDEMSDRLELSTRNMPIKPVGVKNLGKDPAEIAAATALSEQPEVPAVNPMADKLAALRDKIVVEPEQNTKEEPPNIAIQKSEVRGPSTNQASCSEYDQIAKFLHSKIGVLSPKAGEMMTTLIREHGVINFGVSLGMVISDFEADLGVYLAKELEQKLSEGL